MAVVLFQFVTINRLPTLNIIIDLGASAWLLYGTLLRKNILGQTDWVENDCAGIYADESTVYRFLSISLVCWAASSILEFRSVIFLGRLRLGSYSIKDMSWKNCCRLLLGLFGSANSCWVMLNYSSSVHKSFDTITKDKWVLVYYLSAALAKNVRVLQQGKFVVMLAICCRVAFCNSYLTLILHYRYHNRVHILELDSKFLGISPGR